MFEDIPAPQEIALTADQKYRRHRRFAIILNWFVLAYSVVHKLFIPIVLKLFSTSTTVPHRVDAWWFYHILLFFFLIRNRWDDILLRFFLMIGLGGVLMQMIASFQEYNWHTISLWVTSAAAAALIVFILSFSKSTQKYTMTFWGITLGAFVQFAFFGFSFKTTTVKWPTGGSHSVVNNSYPLLPLLNDAKKCGASGFSLSSQTMSDFLQRLEPSSEVDVKECGFSHALVFLPKESLVLRNETTHYLNIKLYFVDSLRQGKAHWEGFQNIPLLPQTSRAIPRDVFRHHDFILIASDSDPKKGMVLAIGDREMLEKLKQFGDFVLQVDRAGLELSPNP